MDFIIGELYHTDYLRRTKHPLISDGRNTHYTNPPNGFSKQNPRFLITGAPREPWDAHRTILTEEQTENITRKIAHLWKSAIGLAAYLT